MKVFTAATAMKKNARDSKSHAQQDLLLASNKQIFELLIHACMLPHDRELETWARLVTPSVKRALAEAETAPL
jgi:hypothetical protein